ncbi:MAG: amidase, partial [Burkholderiaceae bacterium]
MNTDLTQCSAAQLLSLYRSGQASAVEATQAVLKRIEQTQPVLNAFCLVDEAAALREDRPASSRAPSAA